MKKETILKGIPAAPGVVCGRAFILDKQEFIVPPRTILQNEIPIEIARFEEALIRTREEILEIQKKVSSQMQVEHARIFDAHILVLEDRTLIEEVIKRIRSEKLSAEYVFSEVLKKYVKIFSQIEDEYLRERVSDIDDVGRRVLKNLVQESKLHDFENLTEQLIVVSHDLSPSDTVSMYNKNIIAFVTDIGGRTSHTAIMAKTLGVPAVVGLKDATLQISNQDELIIDGRKGLVIIHPGDETKKLYQDVRSKIVEFQERFKDIKGLAPETKDKKKITLLANLELPEEIPTILESGAEGIGLYRTEYFYMNRHDLPSEEEQFEAYKHVAQAIHPRPVTIRTLDLGGDKFISSLEVPKDMYTFLGWRAIRFCLARPDIFKTQLRAILRASAFGDIRLMYPMISGVGELRQANAILNEVKQELKKSKIRFNEKIPVGVMIEVPSAAVVADHLAEEADFFSIGTNDLIQYSLAVDRVREQSPDLYEPNHPAILRLIKNTIEAAHTAKIPISLCGEMSGEPVSAIILLGLGLEQFSMSALNLLAIKKMIRSIHMKDAKELAKKALTLSTGREIEEVILKRLKELAPDVIPSE